MRKMRTLVALLAITLVAPAQGGGLSLEELKSFEGRLAKLTEKVIPATVGLRTGGVGGSGVIVTEDGYVLTAAHVFRSPGMDTQVILHDGRTVEGTTLGKMSTDDYGLIKIKGSGPWPYVEMGHSKALKKGQLCVATGHPGGFQFGRSAPLRLGTILSTRGQWVRSNAIVDMGDSGGPLFDLDGRVIGIHSRIGSRTSQNMHVPVDHYRRDWKRLTKGERWSDMTRNARWHDGPVMGVHGDGGPNGSRLDRVYDGMPADKAGLKRGDFVIGIDGVKVDKWADLSGELKKKKAGQEIEVEIRRGAKTQKVKVTLAPRPERRRRPQQETADMPIVDVDDDPVAEFFAAGKGIEGAFAPVTKDVDDSVVLVQSGERKRVLGTVVADDGWIVTKLSEIEGDTATCTFEGGRELKAKVVSKNKQHDLAFLKVDADDLTPVALVDKDNWAPGEWVVAAGRNDKPISVGVVSVRPRRLAFRGFLGVRPAADIAGVHIELVVPDSAAERAKLEVGDKITAIDGQRIVHSEDFRRRMAMKEPGSKVRIGIKRGDKQFDVEVTIGSHPDDERIAARERLMERRRRESEQSNRRGRRGGRRRGFPGSRLSEKRTGFKAVVQHDAVMNAADCGSPLLDASGRCIAINIARAARYCTYAVPAGVVRSLLEEARAPDRK